MSKVSNSVKLFRQKLEMTAANAFAFRSNRRLLVIESDDWGSIRLVDRDAFEQLELAGLGLSRSPFNSFDCLERKEDLDRLLDVLSDLQNRDGRHPVFTLNSVMCNPCFDRIREAGYQQYHSESLFDSYERYYQENLRETWLEGIQKKLIYPQFHAREHLNVTLWMRDLRAGFAPVRKAFEHQFFGLRTKTSSLHQKHYVAAYSPESPEDLAELRNIAIDGLDRFESTFGFKSRTFIGCNYVWPVELEGVLQEAGIIHFQTRLKRFSPNPNQAGKRQVLRQYTGQRNKHGQTFGVRNVLFEPYLDRSKDWVTAALREIKAAFFWGAPAVLCTHRINYCSHIDHRLPQLSLKLLRKLLSQVIERWPDVLFLTSSQLAELLHGSDLAGSSN
jgi:hypothetical protein